MEQDLEHPETAARAWLRDVSMMRTVFIIGAARSGTKLCRDLLADHPDVGAVPYDVNFLWMAGNGGLNHDLVAAPLPERARKLVANELSKHKEPVVLEKTVSNSLRVSAIADAFPDARFIYLVRDGYDVTESAARQWQAPVDWSYTLQKARRFPWLNAPGYAFKYLTAMFMRSNSDRLPSWGPRYENIDRDIAADPLEVVCAKQWAASNEAAVSGFVEAGVTPLVVRYEDLIADPLSIVNDIYESVDVPPVAQITREVRQGEVGKGRRALDPEVIADISPIIEPTAARVAEWLWTTHRLKASKAS